MTWDEKHVLAMPIGAHISRAGAEVVRAIGFDPAEVYESARQASEVEWGFVEKAFKFLEVLEVAQQLNVPTGQQSERVMLSVLTALCRTIDGCTPLELAVRMKNAARFLVGQRVFHTWQSTVPLQTPLLSVIFGTVLRDPVGGNWDSVWISVVIERSNRQLRGYGDVDYHSVGLQITDVEPVSAETPRTGEIVQVFTVENARQRFPRGWREAQPVTSLSRQLGKILSTITTRTLGGQRYDMEYRSESSGVAASWLGVFPLVEQRILVGRICGELSSGLRSVLRHRLTGQEVHHVSFQINEETLVCEPVVRL